MTKQDLAAIRERDARTDEMWFRGPASFGIQAVRDRRALLMWLDEIESGAEALQDSLDAERSKD